jgi:hypothetical protein
MITPFQIFAHGMMRTYADVAKLSRAEPVAVIVAENLAKT